MTDVGARGFVRSNYIEGLSPQEMWFHAVGGREGLSDTAVRTKDSGYIQRKMVKTMEDIRVMADGTVRNKAGTIIQFAYGDTGLDPYSSVRIGKDYTFINVERLVDEINES
jgi:DNA-directed RNA polymerase II subunit RPB1